MKTDNILLDHSSGGRISHRLKSDLMLLAFFTPETRNQNISNLLHPVKKSTLGHSLHI
jgi:hypothetical protein